MPLSIVRCAWLAVLLALLFPSLRLDAAGQPVTVKELCLMLRSGYTGDEVLRETNGRPLLEPLDDTNEKLLRAAGADTRLVAALRATHPALSADDAAAARAHQLLLDQRNDATRQLQAARLQQTAAPAAAAGADSRAPSDPHYIENMLHGKLVAFRDEQLQPLGASALEGKKLFGLYYSSFVSKEGHTFSPQLVQFYHTVVASHPEFEIIFVSGDRSPFAMENAMREAKMPWPAVAFDQIAQTEMVSRFIDPSKASRLIVVTDKGRMLADYRLAVGNPNLPMFLPDLQKVIDDPTKSSVTAPPDVRPGASKPPTQ